MLIDIDSATKVAGRVPHRREPGFDPLDMKCVESWSSDFSPSKGDIGK
jgi:hypothetical protein